MVARADRNPIEAQRPGAVPPAPSRAPASRQRGHAFVILGTRQERLSPPRRTPTSTGGRHWRPPDAVRSAGLNQLARNGVRTVDLHRGSQGRNRHPPPNGSTPRCPPRNAGSRSTGTIARDRRCGTLSVDQGRHSDVSTYLAIGSWLATAYSLFLSNEKKPVPAHATSRFIMSHDLWNRCPCESAADDGLSVVVADLDRLFYPIGNVLGYVVVYVRA